MRPLVLSKAIELSLVTLWQVRTCSVAVCLSLPSWFLSYRVSLVFFFCVRSRMLQVFDSRVLRKKFGFKGYEGSVQLGYYIMRNFVFH